MLYVIVGATHPDLISSEGEAYRQSLTDRIARLGMERHVRFVDRFVGRAELMQWLQAADVFVTPYPNLGQIVSGTLSYAMGAGRAVVSTPYTYAKELLADGRGVLVAPGSPDGARRRPALGARRPGTARGDRPARPRLQPANDLARRGRGIRRAVREPRPGHAARGSIAQRGLPIHA